MTRRSAVALVQLSHQLDDFFQILRHWHIGEQYAETADAENELVMRQNTKNYMDTNCRNRHERRDIKVHEQVCHM